MPAPAVTLDTYRRQFDLPEGLAYLDHAATGVLSRPVHDAAADFLAGRAARLADRSPNNFPVDLERVERVRARAAALVGADVRHVDVQPNTSTAINLVARGLDWQPGDRIAVASCEFPTNLLPWRALGPEGVEVDGIAHRDGTFTADDVAAALQPRTRVVAVSWVQFLSGFRCDLAAIADVCRAHDVLLVVDAIQGVGALQLDAAGLGIDVVATGSHKWLGGMQGTGFVVVAERLLHRLRPLRGWLNGPVDWDDFEGSGDALHDDATRFRVGTLPMAQLYALDAALGGFLAVGTDVIEAAVLAHAARLAEGLDALGYRRYGSADPAHASGIVTVEAPEPEALHTHLAARGVQCSVRSRKLRLAPHAQTRPADLDRALDAVASFGRLAVPSA